MKNEATLSELKGQTNIHFIHLPIIRPMEAGKRDFYKEYLEAKAKYDALGEKLAELSSREANSFDEKIKKANELSKLAGKMNRMHSQQLKRAFDEVRYNKQHGIKTPVRLYRLDDDI